MRKWQYGDSFKDIGDNTIYTILSCDDTDAEYFRTDNERGKCPVLVVRALETLDWYEKEELIVYIGNIRQGY